VSKTRKPAEGDRVIVNEHWTETVREGTVRSVLSAQFTYVDDEDGLVYFCPYTGDWRKNEPT